jgi:hypothetical protein
MSRVKRYFTIFLFVTVALAGCTGPVGPFDGTQSPSPDQEYPKGAGAEHINFSALTTDTTNVSHSPREHWDSYAIIYTAPSERRLVEGNYYINSTTGEIIGERWNNGTVYLNGSTYAFAQPASSITERDRQQLDSDESFVYHKKTDTYYRYDQQYGSVAPTNIGRHPEILEAYTWEAVDTTTHHGVPVITYRATGRHTDTRAPPIVNGTLRLGVENGVVYAFDIIVDGDETNYHYTYSVHPAPFPNHEWVDRASEVTRTNSSSVENSPSREVTETISDPSAIPHHDTV